MFFNLIKPLYLIDIYKDMESDEHGDSYRPPKTAKIFISTMQTAFQKHDGDRLAKQIRELYFTNLYSAVPEKNWSVTINIQSFNDCQPTMGSSFARTLEFVRDFAQQRAGGRWSECFQKHMQALKSTLRVLQDMKEMRFWLAKCLLMIVRATKKIFLTAQQKVGNSTVAAKLKNSLFNTLQRFKTAKALDDAIKKQFLSLVDVMQVSILLTFHNYEQIQRLIYSSKNYGEISERYIDNFLFQKAKYALVNQNLHEAEQCFLKINLRTRGQKRLVMKYLIPCRILLGRLYDPAQNSKEGEYTEYAEIIRAIKSADFRKYEQVNKKYQKVWLKRGIYLLMDRVRIILWRTLIKRLFLLVGTKIDLQMIEKAVRNRGGSENINECICIVANLIYEGHIKGYIFQNENKRTLVLKGTGNPFPKLDSIAK